MDERVLDRFGQLTPRRVELELVLSGEGGKQNLPQMAARFPPRENHALQNRDTRITEQQLLGHATARPQAAARRAGAERRIEGEVARLELRERDAAYGASELLREELDVTGSFAALRMARTRTRASHLRNPVGQLERGLEGICETRAILSLHRKSIDDHRDAVILPPVQLRRTGDLDQFTVHPGADEALFAHGLEQLPELPFSLLDQWRAHLDSDAGLPTEHDVGDLRRALSLHGPAAIGTVRRSGAGIQQAQVVVDLGDRADGRPRIVAGGLLFDRNRRGQTFDGVDIGLFHEPE